MPNTPPSLHLTHLPSPKPYRRPLTLTPPIVPSQRQANYAAFLDAKGVPLRVEQAAVPAPGPGELLVRNYAAAINPIDWHMQDEGVFVQEWPAVLGSDVAGAVTAVGQGVGRFVVGDRAVGHAIALTTSASRDAAFQLYTIVREDKAARLPDDIPFTAAAALPLALETAVAGLCLPEPGVGAFGIPTPALGLPLPSSIGQMGSSGKTVVVYGASSSVGCMAVQVARAGGTRVVAVASEKNFDLVRQCGADVVVDYHHPNVLDQVITALTSDPEAQYRDFIGTFDTISIETTYAFNLQILELMSGVLPNKGLWLACTHPPPRFGIPDAVRVGMVFGVNDIAAGVWRDWVTPALERGELVCLPRQEVVGRGLESVQEGLRRSRRGFSGWTVVVEL